jgi:hypothetical protein
MARPITVGLVLIILGCGCRSMGPGTVQRDRFDYNMVIGDSVKNQLLLNMVKMRYGDTPVFVDVSSVISQYAIQNQVNYSFEWQYPPMVRTPSVGGFNAYAERPTITYTPLTGDKFTKSLLTPIPPSAIVSLVQSGKPVDVVFYLCVQAVNGITNRYDGPARSIPISPDYVELLARMRRIQQSGMIGMRVQVAENKQATLFSFKQDVTPEIAQDIAWVREKLGLDPHAGEFKVVYGALAQPGELAIQSRSVMEIMIQLSSAIDVPAEDLEQNRAYKVARTEDPLADRMNVRIRCGKARPVDAFVSIEYKNKWFWIDDTDLSSKQVFSGLLTLLSLMEADRPANQPVITVPTG